LSCFGFSTADEGKYAPAHTAEEGANGHHSSTKPSPANVSYLVQSSTFTDRVTAESVGTAYPAIAEGRLGSFYVPVPPLPEQTAIVEYLDAQTAKLDTAIAAARREIELLREYRERLIADVVTGKVDVREVAAQLPEEPPEEEAGTEEEEPVAEELATVDSQEESNGEE
jgi:type I restriction enzyme S subunit